MITLSGISKQYTQARREPGLRNACKALFHREIHVIPALKDISFSVADGEMVGYIGPNGAGKSTTIKIMCGILTPDSGTCLINGRIPWRDRMAHVAEIGVVFGQRSQLWWDIPVGDSFALLGNIYGMRKQEITDSLAELNRILSLDEFLRTPARQLSLGQRMRCEIAAALLHRPKTLFLDEPTIGLDAISKLAVRTFIREINRTRGTTVLLTTHDMQDIDALTPRILLIGRGQLLLDGSMQEIRNRYTRMQSICIEHAEETPRLPDCFTVLSQMPGRTEVTFDSQHISLPQAIQELSAVMTITNFSVRENNVDDMVVSLYEDLHI